MDECPDYQTKPDSALEYTISQKQGHGDRRSLLHEVQSCPPPADQDRSSVHPSPDGGRRPEDPEGTHTNVWRTYEVQTGPESKLTLL